MNSALPRGIFCSIAGHMSEIKLTVLDNGLRVVTDHVPGMHSAAVGAWVGVGTRNEDLVYNGTAHMVEHMLFKGTKTRSSQDIAEVIENVGGQMNAYTSREVTSYHIHLLQENVTLAVDVLADLVQNSIMPEEEIERERHVILQEIGMCHDTPDDVVFDHYAETAFPCQALGAPILGTNEIITGMQRDVLMGYVEKFYTTENIVISAAGAVDHDAFAAIVAQAFAGLRSSGQAAAIEQARYEGGDVRQEKDLEQSHIILGFEGLPRTHDDFYAAQALSTVLGGGMASRLFQEIREKRGLVYSIFSFHSAYRDSGQFGVYAGTGPEDLPELVPVVCEELQKIRNDLSEAELQRAKTQMRSSLLMGRESMMARADQMAKHIIYRDSVLDIEAVLSSIEALDVAHVRRVAGQIFASAPTVASVGPLQHLESYDAIKERLVA